MFTSKLCEQYATKSTSVPYIDIGKFVYKQKRKVR